MDDSKLLEKIRSLVKEEERLYTKGGLTEEETQFVERTRIELDQCWDLLRQRRALREAGKNPDDAEMRPPDIVEKYEQ